ncbi:MAG: bifunctional 4-hydroxy-2-oxoglutarate aldolase/2-dehydro-3-deoxy-phosphogluconate aldolase [Pseudomonadota bacterium]
MWKKAPSVNSAEQFRHVADIGIDGVISPGITENLVKTAHELDLPYLPGVANASDVLLAMEFGLQELKLFPATVVGGVGALKALAGPFPDIKFCPTGGVSQANYQEFLQLDNVMCVGGSWLASSKDIAEQNWAKITANCQAL